jgi:uncharacterized membrane protein
MSDGDRLDRLEARVARLEELLAGKRGSGEAGRSPVEQAPEIPPARMSDAVAATPRPRVPASPLSSEQWVGQRALLAIGVTALILAAGYLLRLSFDRGSCVAPAE